MSEQHGTPHGAEQEKQHLFDKPQNVKRLFMAFYVLCAASVAAGLFIEEVHHHPWENLPAFYPLYGFLGIVVLVYVAKLLRRVAMRPEDYYDVD